MAKPPPSADSGQLWRLAGMGWTLASEIIAGVLIGWAVDHFSGRTAPWGVVVGAIAGVTVGMTTFFRSALRANREAMMAVGKTRTHDDRHDGD